MRNLNVRAKLLIGYAIVLALTCIVGIVGVAGLNHLDASYTNAINVYGKPLADIANALTELQKIRVAARDVVLHIGDQEKLRELETATQTMIKDCESSMAAYGKTIGQTDDRAYYVLGLHAFTRDFAPLILEIIADARQGAGVEELNAKLQRSARFAAYVEKNIFQTMRIKTQMLDRTSADSSTLANDIKLLPVTTVVVAAVISIVLSTYISGLIAKPLTVLSAFMKKASSTGDLTLRPEDIEIIGKFGRTPDETGRTIANCALFVEHVIAISRKLEGIADGDLGVSTELLSSSDTLGLSLKKMVNGLNRITGDLERKNELSDALNEAAFIFLSQERGEFEDTMTEGVRRIAEAVKLDRVALWRNFTMPDGEHASQVYRWDKDSGGTTVPTPGLEDMHYSRFAPSWAEHFLSGKSLNGPVSGLPSGEVLGDFGVVSAFIPPVFINGKFWGVVIFEDRREDRHFDADVADMLRSAAFLCVNAVIRDEMEREIIAAEVSKKTHEADEFARLMFNSVPMACDLWDENARIIDCNEETLRLFGFSDKNEYREKFHELSPEYQPDGRRSRDRVPEIVDITMREGFISFEWLHNDIHGEPIPVVVHAKRVMHGGRYAVAGYKYDMRDERKAQEQAREAEQSIHLMFNSMPLCSLILSEDLTILDCNQETLKVFCLSDKLEYHDVFPKLSPEYQPNGRNSIEMAREKVDTALVHGFSRFEWLHQTLNGEQIPCEVTLVRSEYNDKTVLLSYMSDLREQKKMLADIHNESALNKRMAHWYGSILDAIPFSVSVLNTETRWTFVNAAFEKHMGRKREDCLGVPCQEWKTAICGTDACTIARAKRGVYRTHLSDGESSYQIDVTLLTDMEGKPAGYVEIIQDVTEMELMAKEKAEAEAASHAKTAFLSNMSHEIRTPMNAIIGMTAIGRNAADMERKDYAFSKIEDASTHLLGVINDVLDISKIEANKLELSPVEFEFERMLHKVLSVINFRVDEKRLNLSVNVDSKVPRSIIGDDQRLAQVIMNLLSNAIKFTPEGGAVRLDVTMTGETDGICDLRIEVADTGIGISPEQQDRLFRAFAQAESGTSRKYGGTGLGLVISKHIVELMGGKLWVESELGKGARFIFSIKAARGGKTLHNLLALGINWDTIRVLAVDDMEETRAYFQDLFNRLHITCDVAADGAEALRMIGKSGGYDVCFVDWRMPGMDGIELTQKIKAHGNGKLSVVVMISAHNWEEIRESATRAGVTRYLTKPLLSSAIMDCLVECLGVERRKPHPVDIPGGEFAGKHILLAEDIEINREIVLTLLEDTGLLIDCAENGGEALAMVEAAPDKYDLVLMDVQMPHMDGLEATRRIRALPHRHCGEMPIIAMTANVFKDDIEECLAAGMNEHLGKPLDVDEMRQRLRKYLRVAQ